ncbi:16S rRNA (adenine(1518)-N(6)/adenine(1519)-N(6))-dimethyltransferase RsmA [Romeria aff. gracilis LEGE 07310]|uniref:Ribosomal RNA small subunit methyltransferase A n=1 Tax=Vasconcelosia minhoensis LEGE 07310 TaxID=915328 RepID=A0A8J7AMU0_9CYAN|nr:16S rRNA (adenine(1518)-N(6)/adenine(1519)-N(6))-dimethyltransferase RsmA [Romeria gracilis]MBE9077379.1 16S rRNA (adenine(1518)-N(6)/adenine(1519)-N(6))-dimethyltransferase RsmA [Romeria aff. gracilis LEGE 07310]
MTPRPRKRLGQHWLRSEPVLAQIVQAAELDGRDRVLEIGPGQGVLTQRLLSAAAAVVAVEIDPQLCQTLENRFAGPLFHLIQADFLDLDLAAALADFPSFQPLNKVVANIPYYITGPILEKLLGTIKQPRYPAFDSIVLLVQKEIADRLCARPGTKACGALTVRLQYQADCEVICAVPAKAFYPPPRVESAVVRLRPRPFPLPVQDPARLDQLLKLGFGQKRKMLRNTLQPLVDREQLMQILSALGQNPQARAENLSVTDWVKLTNQLIQNPQIIE